MTKITTDNINNIRGGLEKSKQEKSSKVIALYNLGISGKDIAGRLGMVETDVQQILLNYKKIK